LERKTGKEMKEKKEEKEEREDNRIYFGIPSNKLFPFSSS
jgi:hypothetical protein